jgi:hypothetical protein
VGNTTQHSNALLINARINVNGQENTNADRPNIAIWDPTACMNDERDSIMKLRAAALNLYKTVPAGNNAVPNF